MFKKTTINAECEVSFHVLTAILITILYIVLQESSINNPSAAGWSSSTPSRSTTSLQKAGIHRETKKCGQIHFAIQDVQSKLKRTPKFMPKVGTHPQNTSFHWNWWVMSSHHLRVLLHGRLQNILNSSEDKNTHAWVQYLSSLGMNKIEYIFEHINHIHIILYRCLITSSFGRLFQRVNIGVGCRDRSILQRWLTMVNPYLSPMYVCYMYVCVQCILLVVCTTSHLILRDVNCLFDLDQWLCWEPRLS